MIKNYIHKSGVFGPNTPMKKKDAYIFAETVAKHSSKMEQNAVLIERAVASFYQASFMVDKLGEEYDAIISSVMYSSLYARISDFGIEGAVALKYGKHKNYKIGEKIRVHVVLVDEATNEVRLEIA